MNKPKTGLLLRMERLLEQLGIHSGDRSLINALKALACPARHANLQIVHYGACRHVTV